MSDEFFVACYLQGSTGAVKLADLACERTDAGWAALSRTLAGMYRVQDAARIELRLRRVSAEDAAMVAQGLEGPVAVAWQAACRSLLQ